MQILSRTTVIIILSIGLLLLIVSFALPVYLDNRILNEKDIQGHIDTLNSKNKYEKRAAIRYLGLFGEDAYVALPYLFPMLNDKDDGVRHGALRAIRQIGPKEDMINDMISAMNNKYSYIRREIAATIGEMGELGHEGMPALFNAAADNHSSVRLEAINALSKIGEPEDIKDIIIYALDDENDRVIVAAIWIINDFGKLAVEALPKLKELANDESKWVATNAKSAILWIEKSIEKEKDNK